MHIFLPLCKNTVCLHELIILTCEDKERQILLSSPWFGYGTNYSSAMGGISRNATGHIVGATTAQLYWSIR